MQLLTKVIFSLVFVTAMTVSGFCQSSSAITKPDAAQGAVKIDSKVVDKHKEVVRKFYQEVVNQGAYNKLAAYLAPEFVGHLAHTKQHNFEDVKRVFEDVRLAYPDFKVMVAQVFGEADYVCALLKFQSIQTSSAVETIPIGTSLDGFGTAVLRLKDGMIVEQWLFTDLTALQMLSAGQSTSYVPIPGAIAPLAPIEPAAPPSAATPPAPTEPEKPAKTAPKSSSQKKSRKK
ncbi:MAG: ester cyclase [Calditrichaeota bacterium]|nr:ester cyclase [Calditrichota bacterium]